MGNPKRIATIWNRAVPDLNLVFSLKPINNKRPYSMMSDSTCSSEPLKKPLVATDTEENNLANDRRFEARNLAHAGADLESWLQKDPGVIRNIGGLGCRDPVAQLSKWHCHDYGKVLWDRDEGIGGSAAFVNGID